MQGLLKTASANSPAVSTTWLAISLTVFVALYIVLLVLDVWLMRRYAGRDPSASGDEHGTADPGDRLLMNLQNLWFVLIVVLWSGYFLLEGFDFGVGMLLPFLPRDDAERSAMFASIGPVWDGNEVWLVTAGGATFAAFPAWYATMFSGFYIALLLALFFLIIRVISFEWRTKSESPRWRTVWLWANAVGSFGASLIWGVGFANLLYGTPINSSDDFTGTFWDLFNWYTLLGGLAVVAIFVFHGATFLTLRTQGDLLLAGARRVYAAHAVATCSRGPAAPPSGCRSSRRRSAPRSSSRPSSSRSTATTRTSSRPCCPRRSGSPRSSSPSSSSGCGVQVWAFTMTGLGTIAVIVTLFTSLFPRVMVSSTDFANSLTVSNSASQHYTLAVMSVVALIFVPLVLLYQGWTYHVFRARVGGDAPAA